VSCKGKWNKNFWLLFLVRIIADKNFYGMALQLERKYDRLVLQKKHKNKKEVPKDFLPF